jgi:hypothetical protein
MPFRMAFIEDDWFWFELCIDGLFFTDILITLNTAILNGKNELIVDRKKIFMKYLKSWLLIDLLACIPLEPISNDDSLANYNDALRIFRLPRLYRLLRISRLFKFFKTNNGEIFERV